GVDWIAGEPVSCVLYFVSCIFTSCRSTSNPNQTSLSRGMLFPTAGTSRNTIANHRIWPGVITKFTN
ncbi:hypothetical protein M5D96_007203, partial [Drosophila gunungcola]